MNANHLKSSQALSFPANSELACYQSCLTSNTITGQTFTYSPSGYNGNQCFCKSAVLGTWTGFAALSIPVSTSVLLGSCASYNSTS